jgi:hypothetical protein
VILGPKFDMLEKHMEKTQTIHDMAHLGKMEGEFYVEKNVFIQRMR